MATSRVWRSAGRLADGREIIYFDETPDTGRARVPDRRTLPPVNAASELRYDPLLEEWTTLAAHRQNRTFLPPAETCPLDPSREGRLSEIPAPDYDVVVFENRFPAFAAPPDTTADTVDDPALHGLPGVGRCEVVCFTDRHTLSFADLSPRRARTVIEAWADRTRALRAHPEIACVYPFENRGEDIGVTLHHPHGQIYGYPFVPPRVARIRQAAADHRQRGEGNLFEAVVAAELDAGRRVVDTTEHWVAFVPAAARWPYEIRLFPRRRVPTIAELDTAQRDDLADVYPRLVRAITALFDDPTPYIAAWNQAPVDTDGVPDPEFGLHLQLFTLRRAPGKLKYLAGAESGMGTWINDIAPEEAASRLHTVVGDDGN